MKFRNLFGDANLIYRDAVKVDISAYIDSGKTKILQNNPIINFLIQDFRQRVLDKINETPSLYRDLISGEVSEYTKRKKDSYLSGGDAEILAATMFTECPIKVYAAGSSHMKTIVLDEFLGGDPISILSNNNHYDVLLGDGSAVAKNAESNQALKATSSLPQSFDNSLTVNMQLLSDYYVENKLNYHSYSSSDIMVGMVKYGAGIFALYDLYTDNDELSVATVVGIVLSVAAIGCEAGNTKLQKNAKMGNVAMAALAAGTFGLWIHAIAKKEITGQVKDSAKYTTLACYLGYVLWLSFSDNNKEKPFELENSRLRLASTQDRTEDLLLKKLRLEIVGSEDWWSAKGKGGRLRVLESENKQKLSSDGGSESEIRENIISSLQKNYRAQLNERIKEVAGFSREDLMRNFEEAKCVISSNTLQLPTNDRAFVNKIFSNLEFILRIDQVDEDDLSGRRTFLSDQLNERTDELALMLGIDQANALISKRIGQFETSLTNILEGDLSIRANYVRSIEKELRLFRTEISTKLEEYVTYDLGSIANSGLEIDCELFAVPEEPGMLGKFTSYIGYAPVAPDQGDDMQAMLVPHDDGARVNQARTREYTPAGTISSYLRDLMQKRADKKKNADISEEDSVSNGRIALESKISDLERVQLQRLEKYIAEYKQGISELNGMLVGKLNGIEQEGVGVNGKIHDVSASLGSYVSNCLDKGGDMQEEDLTKIFMREGGDVIGNIKEWLENMNGAGVINNKSSEIA